MNELQIMMMMMCFSAMQGILNVSVCVRRDDFHAKFLDSDGVTDYEAVVTLTPSDESIICIADEDLDRANGSFSFDVAMTQDRTTKPLRVSICSVDFVACFMETIALLNNEATNNSGEEIITMRAYVNSKNATHVHYKAYLDYCNGNKKPTPVDELSKSLIWQKVRTGRLRRALVSVLSMEHEHCVLFYSMLSTLSYLNVAIVHLCLRNSLLGLLPRILRIS